MKATANWIGGLVDKMCTTRALALSYLSGPEAGTNGWCWGQGEAEAQIVLETHTNVY